MEIRTFLREMKSEAQNKFFATQGDNLPAGVVMAILEMPPEFSSVPRSRHELLTHAALDTKCGSEIVDIAELEGKIFAAESAVETGRK
jgi:hypothetical protein